MKTAQEWSNYVGSEKIFPEGCDFHVDDATKSISISWLLKNDPERPHKRSRAVEIVISEEFIEDSRDLPENIKNSIGDDILKTLKREFATYDGNHECPYNTTPDPVIFNITSQRFIK